MQASQREMRELIVDLSSGVSAKINKALLTMCRNTSTEDKKAFVQESGISHLVALLTNQDKSILLNSAKALARMSTLKESRDLIVAANATGQLCLLLGHEDAEVREYAAFTCRSLSSMLSFQNKMLEGESLRLLLARLDDPQLDVRRHAAAAIARILKNQQFCAPIAQVDVMKSLSAFLLETDEVICKSTVNIIRSLAASLIHVGGADVKFGIAFADIIADKVNTEELTHSDGVGLLVNGLFKAFDSDVNAHVKTLVTTFVGEDQSISIAEGLLVTLEKSATVDTANMTIDFIIALAGLSPVIQRQFLKTEMVKTLLILLDDERASKLVVLKAIYCLARDNREARSQLVGATFDLKYLLAGDQELTRDVLGLLVYMAGAEYVYPQEICSKVRLLELLSILEEPVSERKRLALELVEVLVKSELNHNEEPRLEEVKLEAVRKDRRKNLIDNGGLTSIINCVFSRDGLIEDAAVSCIYALSQVKDSQLQFIVQQRVEVDKWLPLLSLEGKEVVEKVAGILKSKVVTSRDNINLFMSYFSSPDTSIRRGVAIAAAVFFEDLGKEEQNKIIVCLLENIQNADPLVHENSADRLALIVGAEAARWDDVLRNLSGHLCSAESSLSHRGLLWFLKCLMKYSPMSKEVVCQSGVIGPLVSLFRNPEHHEQLLELFLELSRYCLAGCEAIKLQGGLGFLAKLISHQDLALREKAMRIIENICNHCQETRDRIFRGGLKMLATYRYGEIMESSSREALGTTGGECFVEAMSIGSPARVTDPAQLYGLSELAIFFKDQVRNGAEGFNLFLLRTAWLLSVISLNFSKKSIDPQNLEDVEYLLRHIETVCTSANDLGRQQYEYYVLSIVRNLACCEIQIPQGMRVSLLKNLRCMSVVARRGAQPEVRFFWEIFISARNAFVQETCAIILKKLVEGSVTGKKFFMRPGFQTAGGGYANQKNPEPRLAHLLNTLCEVTDNRDLFDSVLGFIAELSYENEEVQKYLIANIVSCIISQETLVSSRYAMFELLEKVTRYDDSVIALFCGDKNGIPGLVSLLKINNPIIQRRVIGLINDKLLQNKTWVRELQENNVIAVLKELLPSIDLIDKSMAVSLLGVLGYRDDGAELHNVDSQGRVIVKNNPFQIKRSDLGINATILGQGAYGRVVVATWKRTMVAVKMFTQMDRSEKTMRSFIKEVAIMQMLRHENIIDFFGAGSDDQGSFLVMKLAKEGSLHKMIHESPELLTWGRRIRIAAGIACALDYLHSMTPSIFHRDLKSENVLMGGNYSPKLTDFGLSLIEEEKTRSLAVESNALATPHWCAPERYDMKPFTNKCDMYSYGIVLWELASLALPWAHFTGRPMEVSNAIREMVLVRGKRPEIPEKTPPKYAEWIRSCWAQEPETRPEAREVADALFDMSSSSSYVL